MPEIKFTELPVATTPLVGNEVIALVQSGISKQTTVDEVSSNLQEAYDIGSNGNINLDLNKPFKLTSTVAAFVPTVMSQAQFNSIPNPDEGLISYITDSTSYRVNRGTPSTPIFDNLAFVSNIPTQVTPGSAEMYFQGNTTPTSIPSVSTPVKINGTYVSGLLENFSQSNGTLKCNNPDSISYEITVTVSAKVVSDITTCSLFIKKNTIIETKSEQSEFLGPISDKLYTITAVCQLELVDTDTVEIFISNIENDEDIIVQSINCSITPNVSGSQTTPITPTDKSYGGWYVGLNPDVTTNPGGGSLKAITANVYNSWPLQDFTQVNGLLTYTGAQTKIFKISFDISCQISGGSSSDYAFRFQVAGLFPTTPRTFVRVVSASQSISGSFVTPLSTGESVLVMCQNLVSSTVSILCTDVSVTITQED